MLPGGSHIYLYDLAHVSWVGSVLHRSCIGSVWPIDHVAGLEPYDLYDLYDQDDLLNINVHVFWVGSVLHRSCTTYPYR